MGTWSHSFLFLFRIIFVETFSRIDNLKNAHGNSEDKYKRYVLYFFAFHQFVIQFFHIHTLILGTKKDAYHTQKLYDKRPITSLKLYRINPVDLIVDTSADLVYATNRITKPFRYDFKGNLLPPHFKNVKFNADKIALLSV